MELNKLTLKDLRSLATEQKLEGRSRYTRKNDLVTALSLSTSKNTTLKNKVTKVMEECPVVTDNTSVTKLHARELFFSKCDDKGLNDKYNKLREEILENILGVKYKSFIEDNEEGKYWLLLQRGWKDILDKISKKEHDTIYIKQKGGRRNNYDFDVKYMKGKQVIQTIKVEFKCGGKNIEELPQIVSLDANKSFLVGYASWFYDNYVTKEDPWTRFKDITPSKEIYLKEIYKNESKNKFFIALKEEEKDKDYYNLKSKKTADSIRKWLEENYKNLDLKKLSEEFTRTQKDKIIILWDKNNFNIDSIDENDLNVTSIIGLQNNPKGTSILVKSESNKIQYSMLLRWKNHLGVLKPAWQVSVSRL